MNRFTPGLLGMLLVLSACGATGGPPSGSPEPTEGGGPAGNGGIEHPSGGDEAVLIVDSAGGFVMPEFELVRLPQLVLLGDGRVIMQGAQTLEFPGPALPPLMERRLTEEGVQEILAAFVETGLFDTDRELRGAMSFVADAPDTVFTLTAGDRQVTVSVYALGLLDPGMGVPHGMTRDEVDAHEVLARLLDQLMTLDSSVSEGAFADDGWTPYEPEALRLQVRDVTDQPVDDGGLAQEVRAWPTDGDPAGFGEPMPQFPGEMRCAVVEGADAQTWLEELRSANQLTRWAGAGERRYEVIPRPLLPHEPAACPEPPAS